MALSANANIVCRNMDNIIEGELVIASGSVLYVGALVCIDSDGELVPAADSTAIKFAGLFTGVNGLSATGDGVIKGKFRTGFEALLPCAGTVTVADMQNIAYCTDDAGVTDAATLGPQCGIFTELESATTVWVRLSAPAMAVAS